MATKLIPGFRFHPTDVELVKYFLKRKVMGKKFPLDVIAEVDIYKYTPWDLPDKSLPGTGDLEWYFFCRRGKKYASGSKINRATEVGYWKTTGKDRSIHHNNQIVGMIKTLIFHTGRAPQGDRTNWVIHEYRLEDQELTDKGIPQDSYVICRVFQKEGLGPQNGAQYGKPFNEEEWAEEDEIDSIESVPAATPSAPVPIRPIACHSSVANDMHHSPSGCVGWTSGSCLSGLIPSPCPTHPSAPSNQSNDISQLPVDDELLAKLDYFKGDNELDLNEIEKVDNSGQENNAEGAPCLDSSEVFKDLGDLDNFKMLPTGANFGFCDPDFLELIDLETPLFWQD